MEFLTQNHINTTTQLTISNNTALGYYIFNRDPFFQYFSDGLNNDATTASITITFDATTPVSRISLMDTNLRGFTIFYNGSTANTFSLTNGNTTASNYSSNSATSLYLKCGSTTMVSSVTIDMKTTQTANNEKILGLFVLSDLYLSLTQIPSAKSYKPSRVPKQIVHTLSDGGVRLQNIRRKYNINISLDYLDSTQRDELNDIYELNNPFYFCPFGTATGWDKVLFESVWIGPFDFLEFSDNAASSGFSGSIKLKETPS